MGDPYHILSRNSPRNCYDNIYVLSWFSFELEGDINTAEFFIKTLLKICPCLCVVEKSYFSDVKTKFLIKKVLQIGPDILIK